MHRRMPLATAIVVVLILIAVLMPGSTLPRGPQIPGFDKIVHFAMFFALALAVRFDFRPIGGRRLLVALAVAAAFAAITELCQLFVPGRSCDVFDLLTDVAGFVAGLLAQRFAAALAARSS